MADKKNKLPKHTNEELADDLVKIIGDDNVIAVYEMVGEKPISFAALKKHVLFKSIRADITTSNMNIKEMAEKHSVSEDTVYRLFKKTIFGPSKTPNKSE